MPLQKILVIGGAGYIGSHVVKALLENDFAVTVYDNLSTGQKCNLFAAAEFIEGDILDAPHLEQVMKNGFAAVVHLAAKKAVGESMENPQLYALNNLIGAINILNAMVNNNVKNIVFSSTAAVYGTPQYVPVDEQHPLNPMSFYGFTKLKIEELMQWYSQLKDFHYISLRYFNAVGYAADGSITGREKNPQNLLPIVMEVATGKREKLQVNLGTNHGTSVLEIIAATERVIGRPINYEFAPRRAGDPAIIVASNNKARRILNWQPRYLNIDNIIQTTWNLEIK